MKKILLLFVCIFGCYYLVNSQNKFDKIISAINQSNSYEFILCCESIDYVDKTMIEYNVSKVDINSFYKIYGVLSINQLLEEGKVKTCIILQSYYCYFLNIKDPIYLLSYSNLAYFYYLLNDFNSAQSVCIDVLQKK